MKCFSSDNCSLKAVGFLILLQITVTVCMVGTNLGVITNSALDIWDENIFQNISDNISVIRIRANKLKTIPANIFERKTNLTYISLTDNKLTTLHEDVFQNQAELINLYLGKNNLTTLPPNIFKNQNKLKTLSLAQNGLTTLSENIFKNQKNLLTLNLEGNNLNTLHENIFESQTQLSSLYLANSHLSTLPEKIFKSLINLQSLQLNDNQLQTLSTNMFKDISRSKKIELNGNPWLCECDFLEGIRPLINQIDENKTDDVACNDTQLVKEKLNRLTITNITENEVGLNSNYIYSVCGKVSENDTTKICPSMCSSCLVSDDNSTIFYNCSNSNQSTVSELIDVIQRLSYDKIDLNLDNSNITNLPNLTSSGLDRIIKISAKNNSIKSISVDNLSGNLTEIDLSENKLESFSIEVIKYIKSKDKLQSLVLRNNSWQCDCNFIEMVQNKSNKFDSDKIKCADEESVAVKYGRTILSMIPENSNHSINQILTSELKQKYPDKTICIDPTTEASEFHRIECSYFFTRNESSIFFDCSNKNLTNISSELGNIIQKKQSFNEIVLNLDNTSIPELLNLTSSGLDRITKISAKNNSIKSISVDNLSGNLTEIDLSNNKINSFTDEVKKMIADSKTIKKINLTGNSVSCDDLSSEEFSKKIYIGNSFCDYKKPSTVAMIILIILLSVFGCGVLYLIVLLFLEKIKNSRQ